MCKTESLYCTAAISTTCKSTILQLKKKITDAYRSPSFLKLRVESVIPLAYNSMCFKNCLINKINRKKKQVYFICASGMSSCSNYKLLWHKMLKYQLCLVFKSIQIISINCNRSATVLNEPNWSSKQINIY